MGIFDDVVVNAKSAAQTVGKNGRPVCGYVRCASIWPKLNFTRLRKLQHELGQASFTRPRRSVPQTKPSLQIRSRIDDSAFRGFSAQYASMQG